MSHLYVIASHELNANVGLKSDKALWDREL